MPSSSQFCFFNFLGVLCRIYRTLQDFWHYISMAIVSLSCICNNRPLSYRISAALNSEVLPVAVMFNSAIAVPKPGGGLDVGLGRRANYVRTLTQLIVSQYLSPFLVSNSSARRLWKRRHSFPIPPVLVNITRVKVPFSISRTLPEHTFFSRFRVLRYIWLSSKSLYESAFGCQTLTSKNADLCVYQSPRAWISSLASVAVYIKYKILIKL